VAVKESNGAWRPTGERTVSGVEIYAIFSAPRETLLDLSQPVPADALGQPSIWFRFDVEVDADGDAFGSTGVVMDDEVKDDRSPHATDRVDGAAMIALDVSKTVPTASLGFPLQRQLVEERAQKGGQPARAAHNPPQPLADALRICADFAST